MKNIQTIAKLIDVLQNSDECRHPVKETAQDVEGMMSALFSAAAILLATQPGEYQQRAIAQMSASFPSLVMNANAWYGELKQADNPTIN